MWLKLLLFSYLDAYIVVREFLGENFAETATNNWIFSPSVPFGSRITTCGNYRLVGGRTIFGANNIVERQVTGLPPHFSARIKFLFLKIDSWDDGEEFYITVDNVLRKSEKFFWNSDTALTGNLCGLSGHNEAERTYSEVIPHTASSLRVRLHTNLNSPGDDESWGFSNFELVVYRCDPTCASCTGAAANACTGCNANAALSGGVCTWNTG